MSAELRDYFLDIDGIDGESLDEIHPKEIRITEYKILARNRTARAEYKVGTTVFEDATFTGAVDCAFPKIQDALLKNTNIKNAVLTCRKAGKTQEDFFKVTLTNVFVTSCNIDGSTVVPTVTFTLSFSRIDIQYREQNDRGILGGAMVASFEVRKDITATS